MTRRASAGEAVFGLFDGLNTAIGVVAASAHAPTRLVWELGLTVSLTGALSMGAGTVLEASDKGWRDALPMAAGTFLGTFAPIVTLAVLPFAAAVAVVAVETLLMCAWIAGARGGQRHDWVQTFVLLAAVAVPTVAVALIFGAAT